MKNFNFLDDESSKEMIKIHDDIIQMCRNTYNPKKNAVGMACVSANVHPKGFEPKPSDEYRSFYTVFDAEYPGENCLRRFGNIKEIILYDTIEAAMDEFACVRIGIDYDNWNDIDADYDDDDIMDWYSSAGYKSSSSVRVYEIKFNQRLYEEFIRDTKINRWFDYVIRDNTRFYICNQFLAKASHLISYNDTFEYPQGVPDENRFSESDWGVVLDVARAMYTQGAESGMQYADFEIGFGILLEILFQIDGTFKTYGANMIVDSVNPDYADESDLRYLAHLENLNDPNPIEEFSRRTFSSVKDDGTVETFAIDDKLYNVMKNFRKDKQ